MHLRTYTVGFHPVSDFTHPHPIQNCLFLPQWGFTALVWSSSVFKLPIKMQISPHEAILTWANIWTRIGWQDRIYKPSTWWEAEQQVGKGWRGQAGRRPQRGGRYAGDLGSCLSPQINLASEVFNIRSGKGSFQIWGQMLLLFPLLFPKWDIRHLQKAYLRGNIFSTQWASPQAGNRKHLWNG